MYAVLDIETTGVSYKNEKITEIAIYSVESDAIVDEFVTLLNPERNIPYFITRLTGITNEMVSEAPRFYEVAKKIVELTKDKIIVGHNVTFDYNFIKQEFKALGYEFEQETLCTVKLSRRIFPGLKSYTLGEMCRYLGIENEAKHRASGDARATVQLLQILMKKNEQMGYPVSFGRDKIAWPQHLHPALTKATVDTLPDKTGVYFLLNDEDEIIYVGKSKNIKSRVISHLRNKATTRSLRMSSEVTGVRYEITGSELVALLWESEEIKTRKPKYNHAQRRTGYACGLFTYTDLNGYMHLHIDKINAGTMPLVSFHNQEEAKDFLENMIISYELCQKFCGLYESPGGCFYSQVGKCLGACTGHESSADYNFRVMQFIEKSTLGNKNFLLVGEGRHEGEISIVKVLHGSYQGFGFVDKHKKSKNLRNLHLSIQPRKDTRDARMIINHFLNHNGNMEVIHFND